MTETDQHQLTPVQHTQAESYEALDTELANSLYDLSTLTLDTQQDIPDLLSLEVYEHEQDAKTAELVEKARKGLKNGYNPWRVDGSSGGTYYLRDDKGRFAGVFKPEDEEAFAINSNFQSQYGSFEPGPWGVRKGVMAGEGAYREVAAYILDHNSFARVPATALVRLYSTHFVSDFMPHSPKHCQQNRFTTFQRSKSVGAEACPSEGNWKMGSLQVYTTNDSSAEDVGCSLFSSESVHRIGILDLRIVNTDRHCGNILLKFHMEKDKTGDKIAEMIPIDHGLCLPDFLHIDNDIAFAWMDWPQSKEPFSAESIAYIQSLDIEHDMELIRSWLGNRIDENSLLTLRVGTLLLKKGVEHKLSLYDIGSIVCGQSMTMLLDIHNDEAWELPDTPLNTLIKNAGFVSLEEEQVELFFQRLEKELDQYMTEFQARPPA